MGLHLIHSVKFWCHFKKFFVELLGFSLFSTTYLATLFSHHETILNVSLYIFLHALIIILNTGIYEGSSCYFIKTSQYNWIIIIFYLLLNIFGNPFNLMCIFLILCFVRIFTFPPALKSSSIFSLLLSTIGFLKILCKAEYYSKGRRIHRKWRITLQYDERVFTLCDYCP